MKKSTVKDLKKVSKELLKASKMHKGQAKKISKHVKGMNMGGSVPGNTDTVPAMLTPGEYVIRQGAVDAIVEDYGEDFLEMLNIYDARTRRK